MHGLWWTISCPRRTTPRPSVCAVPQTNIPGYLEYRLTSRKDLALQVLDNVIMTRWKVLPREQCQGAHSEKNSPASSC